MNKTIALLSLCITLSNNAIFTSNKTKNVIVEKSIIPCNIKIDKNVTVHVYHTTNSEMQKIIKNGQSENIIYFDIKNLTLLCKDNEKKASYDLYVDTSNLQTIHIYGKKARCFIDTITSDNLTIKMKKNSELHITNLTISDSVTVDLFNDSFLQINNIKTKNIDVETHGTSHIRLNSIITKKINLESKKKSRIQVKNAQCKKLDVIAKGASNIYIKNGTAGIAVIFLNGNSDFVAPTFRIKFAKIKAHGHSTVHIYVENFLKGAITNNSTIDVEGPAKTIIINEQKKYRHRINKKKGKYYDKFNY